MGSTKVNTEELTSQQPTKENIKNKENHSTIWGKLGTVVQGYTLNPCTRFPPNPTSTKVNNEELTSQQPTKENIKNKENHSTIWGKLGTVVQGYILNPCTRFPPNPTSTRVNTDELTFEHPAQENIEKHRKSQYDLGETLHSCSGIHPEPLYQVCTKYHKYKNHTDELTSEHP